MLATGSHWKYCSTFPQYVFFFYTVVDTKYTDKQEKCAMLTQFSPVGTRSTFQLEDHPKEQKSWMFFSFVLNELMQELFEHSWLRQLSFLR